MNNFNILLDSVIKTGNLISFTIIQNLEINEMNMEEIQAVGGNIVLIQNIKTLNINTNLIKNSKITADNKVYDI